MGREPGREGIGVVGDRRPVFIHLDEPGVPQGVVDVEDRVNVDLAVVTEDDEVGVLVGAIPLSRLDNPVDEDVQRLQAVDRLLRHIAVFVADMVEVDGVVEHQVGLFLLDDVDRDFAAVGEQVVVVLPVVVADIGVVVAVKDVAGSGFLINRPGVIPQLLDRPDFRQVPAPHIPGGDRPVDAGGHPPVGENGVDEGRDLDILLLPVPVGAHQRKVRDGGRNRRLLVVDDAVGLGIDAGDEGGVDRVGQGRVDLMDVAGDCRVRQPPGGVGEGLQQVEVAGLKGVQRDDNQFMLHILFPFTFINSVRPADFYL